MDAIDHAVWVVDEAGIITRANRCFSNRLGLRIQDVIGQTVSRYIAEKNNKSCPITDAIRFRKAISQTIESCRLGNNLVLSCSPLQCANGQRQFVVVLREAIRSAALVDSGLYGIRDILTALPNAAFVADPNTGKVLEVNAAFISTFAITSPGINADDLLARNKTVDRMTLRRAIQSGHSEPIRVTLQTQNENALNSEITCVLRRDNEGVPVASLVMVKTPNPLPCAPESNFDTHLTPRSDLAALNTITIGELN